jgi:hypothetical protein
MKSILPMNLFASICAIVSVLGLSSSHSGCLAGEPHQWFAGTYLDPAIQRPDFFPHTITRNIPEYRQVYNRPRNLTGWIAYKIEPSSQEAMAWQTNHCNGNYKNNAGAYVPMYCYPKPWESLNTRGRQCLSYSSQADRLEAVRSETKPVESIPRVRIELVPEPTKLPAASLGVEVPPPSASLK